MQICISDNTLDILLTPKYVDSSKYVSEICVRPSRECLDNRSSVSICHLGPRCRLGDLSGGPAWGQHSKDVQGQTVTVDSV